MAVLGTLPSGKTKHKIKKQNVANKFTTMHRLPPIQAVLLSPEPSSRNLSSVGQFPSQHFLLQHTNDIIVVHGCAMCQQCFAASNKFKNTRPAARRLEEASWTKPIIDVE
jgi:hypothetical protein